MIYRCKSPNLISNIMCQWVIKADNILNMLKISQWFFFFISHREWFMQSCLSVLDGSPVESMHTDLLTLLNKPESLQVIASRCCVLCYVSECLVLNFRILLTIDFAQFSLEALPNISAKYSYLKQLFVDKKVGDVLCSKFRSVTECYCLQLISS